MENNAVSNDEGPVADEPFVVPRALATAKIKLCGVRLTSATDDLAELEDLNRLTDARRVASVLVAHADRVARRGLPPLATQPEWEMLPATPPQCEPTSRDTLEALVAESIADEVPDRAMTIAASLSVADTGLVTCWRPALTADHLRLSVPFGSAIGLTSDVADGRTVSALHTSA